MHIVSVVIPFFNRIDWLIEAVGSVINQTYPYFEIILVDDGSSENVSATEVMKDRRIHLIRQSNRGPSSARNLGISAAKGKYVAFLDSDDLFFKDKLEKQVAAMENNPEAIMSHTSYYRINGDGSLIGQIKSGKFAGRLLYPEILIGCPIAVPTVMLRRDSLLVNDFKFEETVHIAEDIILWSRISRISRIIGIDEPLTKVRIHDSNAFADPQKQLVGSYNIIEYATKYDNHLGCSFKRKKLAHTFQRIADVYFRNKNYLLAFKFFLRAIITAPFHLSTCKFLARIALRCLKFREVVR